MARRDIEECLRHMVDHAREAVELLGGKSARELERDRVLNLALVRLLELVGEAAASVPAEGRGPYPEIPWYEIVGLRNRLIHGYDSVDLEIVWQTIHHDLPPLVSALERILSNKKP